MRDKAYFDVWQEIARRIVVDGVGLSASDLKSISDNLDFGRMKADYLPPNNLSEKSNPKRRTFQFEYLKKLFECEPERWLQNEKDWLQDQRDRVGLTLEDGKDGLDDVVSVAILSQIIAASYRLYQIEKGEYGSDPESIDMLIRITLRSVNQVIGNPVLKGYARSQRLETSKSKDTAYSLLSSTGVVIGVSGKYLPDPENTLWRLLTLLHKDAITKDAYL